MTSILFSNTPAKGNLHLLPEKTTAITYSYTSDRLLLSAHMEDNFASVDQVDMHHNNVYERFFHIHCYNCGHDNGRRCSSVRQHGMNEQTVCPIGLKVDEPERVTFDVAPAVFQIYLNLTTSEKRFQATNDYQKAFLQATQVNGKRVKFSRNRKTLANTWNDNRICWGRNEQPKSLKSMVKLFFDSPFNNDLTRIRDFVRHNATIKNDIATDNFFRTYTTKYKLVAEKADALFMLHAEDNTSAFFWMIAAGFKPLNEAKHLMLIPLRETILEHEGNTYPGYLTCPDSCKKEWFVTKSGDLIGQL